jgi:hypothetical protein
MDGRTGMQDLAVETVQIQMYLSSSRDNVSIDRWLALLSRDTLAFWRENPRTNCWSVLVFALSANIRQWAQELMTMAERNWTLEYSRL